jgi:serine/threonine-protein kinase
MSAIDDYRILKKLGEGGMGVVYLASHKETQEKVAIKWLKIEVADQVKKQFLDYFIREALVLQELDHPCIMKFKGGGNLQGNPYMVVEYVDGQSLEKEIAQQGAMKLSQAVYILYRVVIALEYAHERKIIHRDLKPANILLLNQDKTMPKVIDFGLGKILDEQSETITRTGMMMGSPFYMPPEQTTDAKRANHRSDIYSLGATFYHMIGGRAPFIDLAPPPITQDKLLRVMHAVNTGHPPIPLRELRPGAPEALYHMVEKSMNSDPKYRYNSATEFKDELKAFIESVKK